MSKFKEGDKFRAIKDFGVVEKGSILVGKEGFTTKDGLWYAGEGFVNLENYLNKGYGSGYLELVQENKMKFDMKENGWYIRYNNEEEFNLVQEWLQENYGKKMQCHYVGYSKYLTNVDDRGEICNRVMHGSTITKVAKEIVLNFKTVVDSVEWPEVETEAQKELAKLQKQIEELSAQAEKLKETIK